MDRLISVVVCDHVRVVRGSMEQSVDKFAKCAFGRQRWRVDLIVWIRHAAGLEFDELLADALLQAFKCPNGRQANRRLGLSRLACLPCSNYRQY